MPLRFLIAAVSMLLVVVGISPAWSAHPPDEHDYQQDGSGQIFPPADWLIPDSEFQPQQSLPASNEPQPRDRTNDADANDDQNENLALGNVQRSAQSSSVDSETPSEHLADGLLNIDCLLGALILPTGLMLIAALIQTLSLTGRLRKVAGVSVRGLVWTSALICGAIEAIALSNLGVGSISEWPDHRIFGSVLSIASVVAAVLTERTYRSLQSEWSFRSSPSFATKLSNISIFAVAAGLLANIAINFDAVTGG
ncbi:hypothetical protein [Maricaulis sp.]|uniref:hypothetical protein n=1 Tax=Maricaulis sp. TaxID=1486257 RepID=UPI0025B86991|nr:hypothetical protein [Maricaulis sp.]